MDYRYSNHVPGVQTSTSIRGESCQAELCHVSCVNLLQHNEKTAVALHLIQFHPLTLPPPNFPSVVIIVIWKHPFRLQKGWKKMVLPERTCHNFSSWSVSSQKKNNNKKNLLQMNSPTLFGVFSNKCGSGSSKWCVYSKLNISCWLIALTATHLLLLLSHRSWHEENSVIEKSRAWSLFAHIWQMGHHRFKGEHLETGGKGWGWGGRGGSEGEDGFGSGCATLYRC